MSRVGKNPVCMPDGVQCELARGVFLVKGRLGELRLKIPSSIEVWEESGKILLRPVNSEKQNRVLWGTIRNLIQNLVTGVSTGFTVNLEIEGVGYKAEVNDQVLQLKLGYSHDISYVIPEGIRIQCPKPVSISIHGIDRQKVGQVASQIISFRKVEPYKGKGIRKAGQFVLQKEGKKK